jgi:hypothetical protein
VLASAERVREPDLRIRRKREDVKGRIGQRGRHWRWRLLQMQADLFLGYRKYSFCKLRQFLHKTISIAIGDYNVRDIGVNEFEVASHAPFTFRIVVVDVIFRQLRIVWFDERQKLKRK